MVLSRALPAHLITRTASTSASPLSSSRRSFSSSQSYNMPSSDPNAVNFAGLKPEESKSLSERSAEPHEEPIIKSLKELYTCKPQSSTYDMYTQDAVFHDPIGVAKGVETIRAQFDALPKLFPRADIQKFRILQNPPSVPKSMLLIDQDVAYYRKPESSPTKIVNSLLTLKLDQSNKVTHHQEEWDHKRETSSDDGFFGWLNEERKKVTASITATLMGK